MDLISSISVLLLLGGVALIEAVIPPDPPRVIILDEGDVTNIRHYYTKELHIRRRRDTTSKALAYSICDSVSMITDEIRQEHGLDPFYSKYTHAYGILIVSSDQVADAALKRACYVTRFLMADREDLRNALNQGGARVSVLGINELTNEIPEFSYLDDSWNYRARGLGGSLANPVTLAAEENLLCLNNIDRWREEDIMVHEIVHTIHLVGLDTLDSSFSEMLRQTYLTSTGDKDLWANTYAQTNYREYLAEGAQSFFNVNTHRDFRDNIHNNISTRAALRDYDPALYDILLGIFPCANILVDRCSDQGLINSTSLRTDCDSAATTPVLASTPAPMSSTPSTTSSATTESHTTETSTTVAMTSEHVTTPTTMSSTQQTMSSTQQTMSSTQQTTSSTQQTTSYTTVLATTTTTPTTGTTIAQEEVTTLLSSPASNTQESSTSIFVETMSSNFASLSMTTISAEVSDVSTSTRVRSHGPTTDIITECADTLRDACPEFITPDECTINPVKRSLCLKTCRACAGCRDYHRLCPDLSERGFCARKPVYMRLNCAKSCRMC
ncbi:uncharacterized protein [Diadema setosum]|uniref:uncharacterized protein n=1 Tax=Diadema setosum TaxID=31175 RepID=UPI003B3ABB59